MTKKFYFLCISVFLLFAFLTQNAGAEGPYTFTPRGSWFRTSAGGVWTPGPVGIGTETPEYSLETNGDIRVGNGQTTGYIRFPGNSNVRLGFDGGAMNMYSYTYSLNVQLYNKDLTIETGMAGSGVEKSLILKNQGTAYFIAGPSGVGIGTTGPLAREHIKASTADGSTDALLITDSGDADLLSVDSDGNLWALADVSAATFTDRTPFYDGDALSAISNIKGADGKIDHTSLPKFAQRTIRRVVKKHVVGPRVPVPLATAFENVDIKEKIIKKDADGKEIVKSVSQKYEIVDGSISVVETPEFETEEKVIGSKRELKPGVKLDEKTGELYTQTETTTEQILDTPGRDLGAMVSILTKAVQQLTAEVEALKAVSAMIEEPIK